MKQSKAIILIISIFMIVNLSLSAKETLKVTTYNLGLAHTFIPYAKERLKGLEQVLPKYDTDVLCLQEVWKKSDQKDVIKALENRYPHVFKTKIKNFREGSRPTCRRKEIFGEGKFVSCMQNQCGGKEGDEFTDCIIDKCGNALEELKETNRTCAQALMAQVGKNPILSIARLLNPFWRTGLFAYKGSNGLMLFSKYPLEDRRYVDFKDISTLNRRSALQAIVNVKGEKIQVMCTHLTADLSATVPYTGNFADWGAENMEQMYRILQTANHKLYPTVVMGDFNCGFADPLAGIADELPGSCQQALDWGYSSPLTGMGECTFCQDNLLNTDEEKSVAIDHVFLKDLEAKSSKVLFKQKVKIKTKDEGWVTTQLSDHYGLEVEVNFP